MTTLVHGRPLACLVALSLPLWASPSAGQSQPVITDAIIGESNPVTPEISTAQLQQILKEGKTPVLDVRSAQEYAIAHIPGSINHYEKEVEQITKAYPDHKAALIFYCNGPYCGKSKRLSEELKKEGYTNIRRYQLGLPVWRALGNTVQTDLAGVEIGRGITTIDSRPGLVDDDVGHQVAAEGQPHVGAANGQAANVVVVVGHGGSPGSRT